MSKNIIDIPRNLYEMDLPPGFECTMYVGRMAGRLSAVADNPGQQQFSFEITDVDDPTEMVLRYSTYEAPAGELARWENMGDTVGVVIAHHAHTIEMVLAYNFTRRKWFATGYYPHIKDTGLGSKMSVADVKKYTMLCVPAFFLCGLGCVALPVMVYIGVRKGQQYKMLNPTDYRGDTAKRIADWISKNGPSLGNSGNPALDPSL